MSDARTRKTPPTLREREEQEEGRGGDLGSAEKREDFAIFAISAHAQEARGGDVLHVLVSETPDEAQGLCVITGGEM